MADQSKIEWTDATFNPWIGCTKVGPGCDHCYAEALMDTRHHRAKWGVGQARARTSAANWKLPLRWNEEPFFQCSKCGWRGGKKEAVFAGNRCPMAACGVGGALMPARRRVFCASLADVFDNEVDPAWRADLLSLIERTPNLDWLLLTKRIGNVKRMVPEATDLVDYGEGWQSMWGQGEWPENVWLGATVVNQVEADRDIPKLLAVPARVRFLSIEPMLGPIDLSTIDLPGGYCEALPLGAGWLQRLEPGEAEGPRLNWIIAGGESGHQARPMHPDWVRSLRDQCTAAGVPFLFKQWGEFAKASIGNVDESRADRFVELSGEDSTDWTVDLHGPLTAHMVNIGKKAAGRLLDGIEHNSFPGAA